MFGAPPAELKTIQPYLKIAEEHDNRDIVIAYWCREHAVHMGLKINAKSKAITTFLASVMDWLEKVKKENRENEAVTNEIVAQAHIENYALKIFLYADGEDRAARFNKNVVKAFYTAGVIYDVVATFGEISEEVTHHRKYAKWKATYIHNCLKNGITPIPGPVAMDSENSENEEFTFGRINEEPGNFGDNINNEQNSSSDTSTPYPTIGFFDSSASQPMNLIPPMSGVHAPPSTPNGSSQPSPSSSVTSCYTPQPKAGNVALQPEDFQKAQKYCKWAGSALQYEDVPTAVSNLEKALKLLTTGVDE